MVDVFSSSNRTVLKAHPYIEEKKDGSFNVDSARIFFIILDEANYSCMDAAA